MKPTYLIVVMGAIALPLVGCAAPETTVETEPEPETAEAIASQTATPEPEIPVAETTPDPVSLTPAENWQQDNHVHALAVHPDNPEILYVATHHGLVQRSPEGGWYWLGSDRSDYMGFVAHPSDPSRLYSSGHPPAGGNLGFRVTDDRGEEWQVLSMPGVDFHALAIAPGDPDRIYGWATSGERGFFVSDDGGETWNPVMPEGLGDSIFGLAVDPQNGDRVIATTRSGVYESRDGGKTWQLMPGTDTAPIIGLTFVESGDGTAMVGYRLDSDSPGLYRSTDGGATWEAMGTGTEGTILYVASSPKNPEMLYAVNENNTIFRSTDGGETWRSLS